MSAIHVPAKTPVIDSVIPDCCNTGVVFRALLFVNLAVLVAILLRSADWMRGALDFIESSPAVELACLLSLIVLCGLRQLLPSLARWGQRLLCALTPAAVTGLIIRLLGLYESSVVSFTHLGVLEGMLLAALFGAVLQHYFELRARAFSPALSEARLQALQARIRPHFLFNSLNAVLSLIRSEPRRAESALEDLSDMFRVLMRDARDMTSMEDEIRLCRQYLSIEKIRLGERLQVHWETVNVSKEMLRRAQMPALLLQPLLENAVHYGVEPAAAPAQIRIQIHRQIDRIEIVIVNPLHAQVDAVGGNQLALHNIRQRLALLYDVEAQLITTTARGFFEVRLRFPYTRIPRAKALA
ncbi:MAG: histidine kinase [Gallionellales bacterium RBG_16_56_9]|nr:MAG: histidine kinase [Gallionellales bacterium RBG_16_56_9]